jgi:hypothetical protein
MPNCYSNAPYLIPYQRNLRHNSIQLRYDPLLDGYELNYILNSQGNCSSCAKFELSLTIKNTNEKYIIGYDTVLNEWRYVLISANTYNLALEAARRIRKPLVFAVSCITEDGRLVGTTFFDVHTEPLSPPCNSNELLIRNWKIEPYSNGFSNDRVLRFDLAFSRNLASGHYYTIIIKGKTKSEGLPFVITTMSNEIYENRSNLDLDSIEEITILYNDVCPDGSNGGTKSKTITAIDFYKENCCLQTAPALITDAYYDIALNKYTLYYLYADDSCVENKRFSYWLGNVSGTIEDIGKSGELLLPLPDVAKETCPATLEYEFEHTCKIKEHVIKRTYKNSKSLNSHCQEACLRDIGFTNWALEEKGGKFYLTALVSNDSVEVKQLMLSYRIKDGNSETIDLRVENKHRNKYEFKSDFIDILRSSCVEVLELYSIYDCEGYSYKNVSDISGLSSFITSYYEGINGYLSNLTLVSTEENSSSYLLRYRGEGSALLSGLSLTFKVIGAYLYSSTVVIQENDLIFHIPKSLYAPNRTVDILLEGFCNRSYRYSYTVPDSTISERNCDFIKEIEVIESSVHRVTCSNKLYYNVAIGFRVHLTGFVELENCKLLGRLFVNGENVSNQFFDFRTVDGVLTYDFSFDFVYQGDIVSSCQLVLEWDCCKGLFTLPISWVENHKYALCDIPRLKHSGYVLDLSRSDGKDVVSGCDFRLVFESSTDVVFNDNLLLRGFGFSDTSYYFNLGNSLYYHVSYDSGVFNNFVENTFLSEEVILPRLSLEGGLHRNFFTDYGKGYDALKRRICYLDLRGDYDALEIPNGLIGYFYYVDSGTYRTYGYDYRQIFVIDWGLSKIFYNSRLRQLFFNIVFRYHPCLEYLGEGYRCVLELGYLGVKGMDISDGSRCYIHWLNPLNNVYGDISYGNNIRYNYYVYDLPRGFDKEEISSRYFNITLRHFDYNYISYTYFLGSDNVVEYDYPDNYEGYRP